MLIYVERQLPPFDLDEIIDSFVYSDSQYKYINTKGKLVVFERCLKIKFIF